MFGKNVENMNCSEISAPDGGVKGIPPVVTSQHGVTQCIEGRPLSALQALSRPGETYLSEAV